MINILKKIKRFLVKILSLINNIPNLIRLTPKILKDGGHLSVNISYIDHDKILKGKNIIITGGGSGIGLAIARKALNLGAKVLITGRNIEKLKKTSDTLNNENLKYLAWDVSDVNRNKEFLEKALKLLDDKLDILVNNAGVLSKEVFPSVSKEDWDYVYNINSKGLFFLTQEIYKFWSKTKNKKVRKIINISSQGGYVGATYPYRMTKWDISGLTQGLGLKLVDKNIIVNGIAPGIISTDMQERFLNQGDNNYCELNPQKRIASPNEIAELAAYLLSDASNFIVGQTIICDGGYSIL